MPFLVNTRKTALPGQSFFTRIIFHFFLLLLVIFSFSASAGISSLPTNAECKNLAKVNDIDDLLYQLYSNLDSHCLFDMDTAELEKIWGIRVFDLNSAPYASKEYYAVISEMNEFDKTEEAFYVKKKKGDFRANPNFEIVGTTSYYDKHNGIGGEISQGRFPKYLPPPHIWEMPGGKFGFSPPPPLTKDTKPLIMPENCVYKPYHYYYWIHDKNRPDYPIMFMKTYLDPISGRIIIAYDKQSFVSPLPF